MNTGTATGLAAGGGLVVSFALMCMYGWKTWFTLSTWLMFIGGVCLAIAGWGPLAKAVGWVFTAGTTVGQKIGWGGAIVLFLALVITVHPARAMHPKKGPQAGKATAWAALFAGPVIIGLGGLMATAHKLQGAGGSILDGVGAFLNGAL